MGGVDGEKYLACVKVKQHLLKYCLTFFYDKEYMTNLSMVKILE